MKINKIDEYCAIHHEKNVYFNNNEKNNICQICYDNLSKKEKCIKIEEILQNKIKIEQNKRKIVQNKRNIEQDKRKIEKKFINFLLSKKNQKFI